MTNKEILITGGTGTLGNALVKLLLDTDIKGIRIFSRDELKQHEMRTRLDNPDKVAWLIGDVRDPKRLTRAMEGVDIVIHAAAMKQVPACEEHPLEAIQTNIHGAENVLSAALANQVEKVMNVSTDKAVYPINLYGATKMAAEKLFINGNVYGGGRTKMSCCRYGNVFGSRGSVVPMFIKARETGVVNITHPGMTRFWITVNKVAQFLIDRICDMEGGEIFIPIMPKMSVLDLATIIVQDSKVEYEEDTPWIKYNHIGTRPGEKTHETLIAKEEGDFTWTITPKDKDSFYKITSTKRGIGGPSYNSETYKRELQEIEIQQMLKEME